MNISFLALCIAVTARTLLSRLREGMCGAISVQLGCAHLCGRALEQRPHFGSQEAAERWPGRECVTQAYGRQRVRVQ